MCRLSVRPSTTLPIVSYELAAAVVVHGDRGDAGFGGDAGDLGLAQEAVDVVHERRAGFEGGFRYFGLVRVDADGDVEFAGEAFDHGQDAAQLFVRETLRRSRDGSTRRRRR